MGTTTKLLLGLALFAGLVGGILAFAIYTNEASAGPFDLNVLGGVLLALAVVLAAGVTIVAVGPLGNGVHRSDPVDIDSDQLRTITGLVAVVAGIIAVGSLTIVTVHLLGGNNKEATVAITTSAFGIVSTVITAFLGIKATANASKEVNKELTGLVRNQQDPKGRRRG